MKLKTPIILALDIDDFDKGLKLCRELEFGLGAIKIGPRLLMQHGAQAVQKLAEIAPVFVDNKYFDIPNTMESAIRQTFKAGASLVTIHALSGGEAMKRLSVVEAELNAKRPFKLLAVTILTSFVKETLPPVFLDQSVDKHVEQLTDLAFGSGLSGLVCSPHEVFQVSNKYPRGFFVTPGIRLAADTTATTSHTSHEVASGSLASSGQEGSAGTIGSSDSSGLAKAVGAHNTPVKVAKDDQSRVMTPEQALTAGATALVIGRPLLEARDPKVVLTSLISGSHYGMA